MRIKVGLIYHIISFHCARDYDLIAGHIYFRVPRTSPVILSSEPVQFTTIGMISYLLGVLLCLLSSIFVYFKWKNTYWSRQNVPHDTPELFWGNLRGVGQKYPFGEFVKRTYLKYCGSTKMCGMYMLTQPLAVICDLDLVKTVLIKDFNCFLDRGHYINEKVDPLSANLLNLYGDRWKALRAKLSPAFSSGKIKMMSPSIAGVADNLVTKLRESKGSNVDATKIFSCFTTDVIGNCAFGLDCNSFTDERNEFLEKGKLIFNPTAKGPVVRLMNGVFRKLSAYLGVVNTPRLVTKFFYEIAEQNLAYREKENIKREDFFNFLMQLKSKSQLTLDEVAAQMFIFQVAGYETVSKALTYLAYELTLNPDIQQKAREEIREAVKRHNNEVSYEAIVDMPYLDCVINEALRKYPPTRMLLRRVTVDKYKVPGTNFTLKKEDLVTIPIYGIHHDPAIYPNPDIFDPTRFLPEEASKRHSMAFIPFGEGYRICIGFRFSIMEIKVAVSKLLLNFQLDRGDGLADKMEFHHTGIVLTPKGEVNMKFNELDG